MRSKLLMLITFCACMYIGANAQIDYPSLSPAGRLLQHVGFTTITVDYDRPAVRQREIFGGLVPWGKVWRTGAGHCTVIHFSKAVNIYNNTLKAGAYSLFTIPGKDNWTVIFNKDTTLYGSYDYDEKKDALRFTVKPQQTARFYESMTIDLDVIPNNAEFYVSWANTQIHFPINTGTDEAIEKMHRSQLIDKRSTDLGQFTNAAFYYLQQNQPIKAMHIVHEGFVIAGEKECHLKKAQALEKQGRYDEAISEVKKEITALKQFISRTGYDQGLAVSGFEAYIRELEKKKN